MENTLNRMTYTAFLATGIILVGVILWSQFGVNEGYERVDGVGGCFAALDAPHLRHNPDFAPCGYARTDAWHLGTLLGAVLLVGMTVTVWAFWANRPKTAIGVKLASIATMLIGSSYTGLYVSLLWRGAMAGTVTAMTLAGVIWWAKWSSWVYALVTSNGRVQRVLDLYQALQNARQSSLDTEPEPVPVSTASPSGEPDDDPDSPKKGHSVWARWRTGNHQTPCESKEMEEPEELPAVGGYGIKM